MATRRLAASRHPSRLYRRKALVRQRVSSFPAAIARRTGAHFAFFTPRTSRRSQGANPAVFPPLHARLVFMSQGAAAAAVLESSAGHSPSGFHAGTFVERRKAPRGFAAAAAWAPTVLDLPLNPLQLAPADRRPALAWPVVAAAGNLGVVYQTLKRAFDIAGSLALLVAFSPLMLVALVALCITTKGKPIFSQDRVGLCGRRFRMFKFRTMVLDAAKLQHLVKNEQNGPVFKN